MRINSLVEKSKHIVIDGNELVFSGVSADELLKRYGSPLYLYSEEIIRRNCRKLKNAFTYPNFHINYSVKANTNLSILRIMREEGVRVDAMSPGEIFIEQTAGYQPNEIFFIPNNVSAEELLFAVERGIRTSVDSLDQLELFGRTAPGGKVAVRINPGVGAGHHQKVVTGGEKAKFGVELTHMNRIMEIAEKYGLTINGLNMHIGSNFLDYNSYLDAAGVLMETALKFEDLEFLDIGGGLGVSYKDDSELDVNGLGRELSRKFNDFSEEYGRDIDFLIEPGRFLVADAGLVLTSVHAVKNGSVRTFVGTDCGFNILMRPMAYGSYHEIVNCMNVTGEYQFVDICGNICESGDLLAEQRPMTETSVGDVLAVLDAGAYGYSMASNYNCRVRPAEVLLTEQGEFRLIRRRDNLNDLLLNQVLN